MTDSKPISEPEKGLDAVTDQHKGVLSPADLPTIEFNKAARKHTLKLTRSRYTTCFNAYLVEVLLNIFTNFLHVLDQHKQVFPFFVNIC